MGNLRLGLLCLLAAAGICSTANAAVEDAMERAEDIGLVRCLETLNYTCLLRESASLLGQLEDTGQKYHVEAWLMALRAKVEGRGPGEPDWLAEEERIWRWAAECERDENRLCGTGDDEFRFMVHQLAQVTSEEFVSDRLEHRLSEVVFSELTGVYKMLAQVQTARLAGEFYVIGKPEIARQIYSDRAREHEGKVRKETWSSEDLNQFKVFANDFQLLRDDERLVESLLTIQQGYEYLRSPPLDVSWPFPIFVKSRPSILESNWKGPPPIEVSVLLVSLDLCEHRNRCDLAEQLFKSLMDDGPGVLGPFSEWPPVLRYEFLYAHLLLGIDSRPSLNSEETSPAASSFDVCVSRPSVACLVEQMQFDLIGPECPDQHQAGVKLLGHLAVKASLAGEAKIARRLLIKANEIEQWHYSDELLSKHENECTGFSTSDFAMNYWPIHSFELVWSAEQAGARDLVLAWLEDNEKVLLKWGNISLWESPDLTRYSDPELVHALRRYSILDRIGADDVKATWLQTVDRHYSKEKSMDSNLSFDTEVFLAEHFYGIDIGRSVHYWLLATERLFTQEVKDSSLDRLMRLYVQMSKDLSFDESRFFLLALAQQVKSNEDRKPLHLSILLLALNMKTNVDMAVVERSFSGRYTWSIVDPAFNWKDFEF